MYKRVIICVFALVLIVGNLSAASLGIASVFGDIDGDGVCNTTDLAVLKKHLAGMTSDSSDSQEDAFFDSIPSELKGSTVYFATWIDHTQNESAPVFENFTERTGINVELTYVGQNEYPTKLTALIAADSSPDVLVDIQFPALLDCLMPLEQANVDATDTFWDQQITEIGHIGEYHYLVNAANSLWRMGSPLITYNRTVMEKYGVKTPGDYIAEDNWNLTTFKECASQVMSHIPNQNYGVAITGERWVAIYGDPIITYNASTSSFYNTSNTSNSVNAWKYLIELKELGLAKIDDLTGMSTFGLGRTAMFMGGGYAMRNDGWFSNIDGEDIGYANLPKVNSTDSDYPYGAQWRAYGICKDSKNPVAAGYFLRYYLNSDNYDLSTVFKNQEAINLYKNSINKWNYNNMDWLSPASVISEDSSTSDVLFAINNSTYSQVEENIYAINKTVQKVVDLCNNEVDELINSQN